jgi:hypothetical protein
MRKRLLYLFSFTALLILGACKKDTSSSNGNPIAGNWKFISVSAVTQAIVQTSDGVSAYKTITNSAYTSTNNSGTVTIASNTMSANGIAYSITDTAYASDYQDNVLIDTFSQVFTLNFPASNSVSNYRLINADSVYFTGQGIFTGPGATGSTPTGARLHINGNVLTMTSSIVKDSSFVDGGYPASNHEMANVVSTLQRQ